MPEDGREEDEKTPDEGRLDFSNTADWGREPIEGRKLNLPMLLIRDLVLFW
jgi:hypothetical protein